MATPREFLEGLLERALDEEALTRHRGAAARIAEGVPDGEFCATLSAASRYARGGDLGVTEGDRRTAGELVKGWNPERWTRLVAARSHLILSRPDLEESTAATAIREAFRYADEGELCALYATLALLPRAERFAWQAGEGCRTNMRTVFEAVACDTPYPSRYFDDAAWNQCLIKCVFVEAPLWRVYGLDARLSPELARMALDLAEERRSAGRPVQPELWLCLGPHGGARGLASLEQELASGPPIGRAAAAMAMARAGEEERLRGVLSTESDPRVLAHVDAALDGEVGQEIFRTLLGAFERQGHLG